MSVKSNTSQKVVKDRHHKVPIPTISVFAVVFINNDNELSLKDRAWDCPS